MEMPSLSRRCRIDRVESPLDFRFAQHVMTHDQILSLYAAHGGMQYAGEPVSQIEHAWQCGRLAARAGASPAQQLAAWLHDIGHLIVALPGSPTVDGIDDRHEIVGASALKAQWGDEVAEPVRLHVQAKRYLVTVKPEYRAKLSEDSLRSLQLQGGVMSDAEINAFRRNPFSEQAIQIRVWDDLGKSDDQSALTPDAQRLQELARLMQDVSRASAER